MSQSQKLRPKLAIVDSYLGDSHRIWANRLCDILADQYFISLHTLPGRHWKWHMEYGAIALAQKINASKQPPNIILATDMVNLALLKSLVNTPASYWLYMHENQITYPLSPNDPDRGSHRSQHYGFINFTSCLVADRIIFNSQFHQSQFLESLPSFLKQFPKNKLDGQITNIEQKSEVIHVPINLIDISEATVEENHDTPIILWNHRWEHDKNPLEFLDALIALQDQNIDFKLILLGQGYDRASVQYGIQTNKLSSHIIHQGFANSRDQYLRLLSQADIVVSTAWHEFFGISVCEAILAGVYPVLPMRLSYPELIPESSHGAHLYEGTLLPFFRSLLISGHWRKPIKHLRQHLHSLLSPEMIAKRYLNYSSTY